MFIFKSTPSSLFKRIIWEILIAKEWRNITLVNEKILRGKRNKLWKDFITF